MSGVIRWEDPPPVEKRGGTGSRVAWSLIAAQLRERPGVWAVVVENDHIARDASTGIRIKEGYAAWFRPAGAFEATRRTKPDGRCTLYARYVGEPS